MQPTDLPVLTCEKGVFFKFTATSLFLQSYVLLDMTTYKNCVYISSLKSLKVLNY